MLGVGFVNLSTTTTNFNGVYNISITDPNGPVVVYMGPNNATEYNYSDSLFVSYWYDPCGNGLCPIDVSGNGHISGNFGFYVQTSSPTPTPLPVPAPPPTCSATPQCSGTDSEVNIGWSASNNTDNYLVIRCPTSLDCSQAGNWSTIAVTNNATLAYTNTGLPYNTGYNYAVVASNTAGTTTSNNCPATTNSCAAQPPTASITINNAGNTSFGGVDRTSGKKTADSGSDWNNPINVTLAASPAPNTSISKYQVDFFPGFTLDYVNNVPHVNGGPCSPSCFVGGVRVLTVTPLGINGNSANWQVIFGPDFGNRNMTVTGFAVDQNNQPSSTVSY